MKETLSNLKFTWKYVRNVKGTFFKYIFLELVGIVISVVIPILGAKEIIYLTNNTFHQLLLIALAIYVIENLNNIVRYFCRKCNQFVYRETLVKLQMDLGKSILKLENATLDENSSGVFIQRLTGDTDRLADIFNYITAFTSDIISNIGIFGAVFIINKIAFIYLVLITVLLYIIEKTRTNKYNEEDKKFRKDREKVTGFIGEIVRGIRDIKMLNSESSFLKSLDTKIVDLNQKRYKMSDTNRKFKLMLDCTYDIKDLLLIILLICLIELGNLEIAMALIIYNYSNRVNSIIYSLGMLLDRVKDFNLSTSRIKDIMDDNAFKKENFGDKHLKRVNGDFEFKNVSFKYQDKDVLKDVSFKINANETVAFVGKSGSGKTTIFNLLCKMYDISGGEITIDGININELDKDSIRGNITIINQQPYIFNMSIRDNFNLMKDNLTEKEMIEACKMACLHDFIMTLPDGYDTLIGEGGVNLSGGQRQRMAIARALVQKTEIILFDEATSALDNETQAEIQEAINNMQGEYTILIIAHRLSTVINSDRILFLNDGVIEDVGTHDELLKKNKNYKNLYEAELKK